MGLGFGIGIRRRDLVIDGGDRHIVCGHREGDSIAVDIHRISGQTLLDLPIFEGHAIRLPCNESDFLTICTLFWLPVHGQGVGVLLVLRGQRDVVCWHREVDGLAGGVHISGQTSHFPTGEGVTFLLGCGKRDFLTKCTRFCLPVHSQCVGVLLVLRGQRDLVCGHREVDGLAGGVRTLGHAIYLPTGEGVTFLLGCGKSDFLTKCTVFFLPVHGQGVVNRLIVVRHPHVIAGHEELEFDMRAGVGDGIRILCQTFDLPDNVIAFLLVSAKGDLIAHVLLHAFLTIPVVLRLGRLGYNIGAYLIDYVLIIGVGVFNIVLTRRHLDVHIVAAGGGGNRLVFVGAVQQSHLRVGIVIIFAFVFHRVLGGIVGKVRNLGRIADRVLTHNNGTGLVFCAFFCNDGSTITTKLVRIRYLVGIGHVFVYTGNALKLSRKLANAFWAGQREGAIPVVVGIKVLQRKALKALKGQLFSYGVAIRQLVIAAVVVIVILHSKPDVVGTCLGGHRFRSRRQVICSAVLKGSLRDCVAIILRTGIGCRTGVEVKAEVPYRRPIFAHNRFLCNQNAAGRVPLALRGLDVYLIAAVLGLGRDVVKLCVVVGAHRDEAQLANALLIAGNDRVLRSPLNLKVALLQGREGQLFDYGVSIRQLFTAAVVVIVILHHKPDVVGTCLGGHRFRSGQPIICSAVLKGSLRNRIAEILLALIGCSTVLEVKVEVRACRLVRPYTLIDLKFAALVQRALFGTDVHLINAVHIRMREVVELFFVVGTYKDNARLAHAFLFAGNTRDKRAPVDDKVLLSQGRERQLFGGFAGLVYHNIRAVIATVKVQSLAVRGKLCAVISADRLAVDVRDRLGEGKHHPGIANAVNSGYICHGIAVDIGHNAIHATQLALLLTGGKVCAVDAAKAHRIGNSSLAVITRQAAKDHGVLDDHCLRCIVGQLDIVEHTGGDLSLISQFDRCVEHAAGNGAGRVEGDFLLEVSAFNNGVIELDRSIGIHTGNRHVLQRDAIALQRRLRGVDLTRGQVYRVAVRAGDEDLRRGSLLMVFVFAGHNGVLPALPLIEGDLHALTGHLLGLHAGQVGQTVFGNAQGLDRADIGGLVHQNICAVIIAGNAQHLARGRGVGVVVFNCLFVDAQHIGVQRDICSACAHQIDGIGGKGQVSAVYCRNIAVAHHQLADFLPGCQCTLKVVRQRTKHGIRNGKLAVIEKGTEHTVQNNCIGNGALAVAGQGVKDTAGNFDLAGAVCRADANTSFGVGAAGDLAAGKHQSALFAKRCVRNGGIGQLNRAVDGCMAQLFEIDLSAALICHRQNAPRIRDVGIAGIGPVAAQVGLKLIFALVQTFHAGHTGQVGQTLIGKAQFLAHGRDRDQLHGCFVRHRDHAEAGRERSAVCADRDLGNNVAIVCEVIVGNACGQGHNAAVATGSSYRPALAGGIAFHHQLQFFPSAGIVVLLDDINIPCFLPTVQGAVLRQEQLVCLLLRAVAQAGDIAEVAAPDTAVLLGQLIIGTAVNGAVIQHCFGVAAVQNVNTIHIVGVYQKCTRDSAVQQIHNGVSDILDGHIAADRAVQNVLCRSIFNAGDGQPGGFIVAPAGAGCCLGQTVRAGLDLDHLIICFRVSPNILMLAYRAVSDAVGLFRHRGRKPCPCICKCGYREDGEHHTECQYHAHDAFFHDILSFVG